MSTGTEPTKVVVPDVNITHILVQYSEQCVWYMYVVEVKLVMDVII